LLGAILIALVVAGTTSGAAFGSYNPAWDGTSDFRDAITDSSDLTVAQDTDQYADSDPEDTVAFVIAPDTGYADEDLEALQAFLEGGGTLVVLENFGPHGDAVLTDLGAEAQFDGQLVLDESTHGEGPAMPVATGIEDHAYTDGVDQLSLNYATVLEPHEATTLITTTQNSYLGANASAEPGDADELTAYPVATVEPVSNGSVVAVADPSITINAMYGEPDNEQFLTNLYSEHEHVIIDASHTDTVPPLTGAVLALRGTPLLSGLLGFVSIGLVFAYANGTLGALWNRYRSQNTQPAQGLSEDELKAVIQNRHPDWDEETAAEVIAAFKRDETKRGDNADSRS